MMEDGFVVVARFADTTRAERFRSLLADHSIATRMDGDSLTGFTVSVPQTDESRALDLAMTMVIGLDTDRMGDTPLRKRLFRPENWLLFAAVAALLAAVALVAWWVTGVAGYVHVGSLATIGLLAALNAWRPGRRARARRQQPPPG